MFVETFIKRPVVAIVCAIAIILIGSVTITTLPIAQYPQIAPPQVQVTAIYTGASAQVVESTVTNILEQELNGVEGIRYISSSSTNSGASAINLTFENDRDIDLAAVDVQNRIASVQAQLPVEVQRTGVNVRKQSANFLMALAVYTPDNTYDRAFLSNYTDLYIAEALKRIRGVSGIQIFGERRYAMRLWLDPERLASRQLTIQDVIDSLNEQNIQVGAGQIGQSPNAPDQDYQLDLEAFSRFTEVSQFEGLVLDTAEDGSLVRLSEVGRVELGAEDYNTRLRFRGQEGVGLGVTQLPGSNALTVAKAVKAEMARLAEQFPPGMTYDIGFDTTAFVEASMTEVVWSLIQAIALVVLIIFVFLQDWRTTLIPAITIPTSLIGTFLFVKLFGFSINTLTLFGLTLATGMVVDDAIIVVENTFRLIQDEGMRPYEAAVQSMRELTGAVIATSLVLMAVFIPVAFFPGTTGALYRQFALTIAFSIAVSTFLALTFTPSVSALLLRANPQVPWPLRGVFNLFNRFLETTEQGYGRSLQILMRGRLLMVGFFAVALAMTAWVYLKVPQGFLPEEDQGYFITLVQAPEGVSLNYTNDVVAKVEAELLKVPEVEATFGVAGFSFTGSSASNGIVFSPLKPWSERRGPGQSVQGIIGQLFPKFMGITEARVFPVNPPPINGLGTFGGFTFQLQDRRGVNDLDTLVQTAGQIVGQANQKNSGLQNVFTTFAASTPKLDIDVNREAAKALQIPIDSLLRTIQASIASQYVNDFTLGQRNYRVYVQADEPFRDNPDDLNRLYVRSDTGQLFTVGSFIDTTPSTGARSIDHFNLHRSIAINGGAAPGQSSGDAIATMAKIADQILPPGLSYEWAGTSAEEVDSGGQAPFIFGLGLVFVFLVLAAQYENFIDPLIIMLAVPLAVLGALLAQSARGLINDVYCQVGLVMLIGLASKNAILIVEFANQLQEQGMALVNAAVMAARERLRPILMTAISTLCGIFPLVIATGAGAGSRQALGTAVFGGMFLATFLTLFMVPVLYVVILSLQARLGLGQPESPESKFSNR